MPPPPHTHTPSSHVLDRSNLFIYFVEGHPLINTDVEEIFFKNPQLQKAVLPDGHIFGRTKNSKLV